MLDVSGSSTHLSKKRMVGVLLNVLSVLSVFLLYLNWLMIGPFFSSVFWAAIISIVLRGVRDSLVGTLDKFRAFESGGTIAKSELIPTSSLAGFVVLFLCFVPL